MKVRLLGRFSVFIAVARNYFEVGLETKRAGSRSCQASREGSDVSDRYPRSCARNSGLKVLGKPSESTILGWLPALDGLRALAILAVLIHHGNTVHFSNWALGNAGVAIFFSISGFLAYFVLSRDEQKLGAVDYNYFLLRRIFRIWPTYFVIIGLALYMAAPTQLATTDHFPLFTFTANWHQAAHLPSQLTTLSMLWSIAVEEQFYVLAPFMYRALRSRHWMAFSISILLLSNAGRLLYAAFSAGSLYYLTYSYADIFLGGALAAKWYIKGGRLSRAMQYCLSISSLCVIVMVLRLWGPSVGPPYSLSSLLPYPILGIAAAGLLMSVAQNQTLFDSILSSAPMKWVGDLSYSLYLIHITVIMALVERLAMPSATWRFNLIYFPTCLAVAFLLRWADTWIQDRLRRNVQLIGIRWPAMLMWSLFVLGLLNFFRQ
jgi:peptidoglycan/LPS O-acetylase OafA/YrhL